MKDVVTKTEQYTNEIKSKDDSVILENVRLGFDFPQGASSWSEAWVQEKKMIVKLWWINPVLKPFDEQYDGNVVGEQVISRTYDYIVRNNIERFHGLYNMYSGVSENVRNICTQAQNNENNMMCKLTLIFDRLKGLIDEYPSIPDDQPDNRAPRSREELAMLYLLTPQVYKTVNIDELSKHKFLVDRLRTLFQSMYENVLTKDSAKISNHFGRLGTITIDSRKVCDEELNKDFTKLYCLIAETFERMNKLRTALENESDNWETKPVAKIRAGVLIWLLITPTREYLEYETNKIASKFEQARNLLKLVYQEVHDNEINPLQDLATIIPTQRQLKLTTAKDCAPNFESIKTNLACSFNTLVNNLAVFLKQYRSKDDYTKNIDLTFNYREKLRQVQIENVQSAVEQAKLEIKSDLIKFTEQLKSYFNAQIGARFSALETYFTELAKFDKGVADADITFLKTRIDLYKTRTGAILNTITEDITKLQEDAVNNAKANEVFAWLNVVTKTVFAFAGLFLGDISGFADSMDIVQEASQAGSIENRGENIGRMIEVANAKLLGLLENLQNNLDFLDKTKLIIDQLDTEQTGDDKLQKPQEEFLDKYNEYDPKVTGADIDEVRTMFENILNELDTVLSESNTVEGENVEGENGDGHFNFFGRLGNIKVEISKLMALVQDSYEFQFELMDKLAVAVRAHIASTSAQGMSSNFQSLENQDAISENNEEALVVFEQMALSTYIISHLHTLTIIVPYCNAFSYVNAGSMHPACTRALTTLKSRDITNALSLEPPSCDEVTAIFDIPTSNLSRLNDLNPKELYSSEETVFKIPNPQWLVDNNWISSRDKNKALYIKEFEIFAYVEPGQTISDNIRVEIYPDGPAPLYPTVEPRSFRYNIEPVSRVTYVSEYKIQSGSCPSNQHINDPYLGPFNLSPMPIICFRSRGTITNPQKIYPSIFSKWIIRMFNAENIDPPVVPAMGTTFKLKAFLKICRKTRDSNSRGSIRKKTLLSSRKESSRLGKRLKHKSFHRG